MKTNFFTNDEEIDILKSGNNTLLLNKLIAPYLRRYPLLVYYDIVKVNNDAIIYLNNEFAKYDAYKTSAKDKFYDFCVKKLRLYAKKLLKEKTAVV